MSKDYTIPETRKYPIVFNDADMQADYEHNRELGASHNEAVTATKINFSDYIAYIPPFVYGLYKNTNQLHERFNY